VYHDRGRDHPDLEEDRHLGKLLVKLRKNSQVPEAIPPPTHIDPEPENYKFTAEARKRVVQFNKMVTTSGLNECREGMKSQGSQS
jgi:hypothetical protein